MHTPNRLSVLVRTIAIFCLSLLVPAAAPAARTAVSTTFGNETFKYRVMFKWGLVNKQAGEAILTVNNQGENYRMLLTAKSAKWADRFYRVRDTLSGVIQREDFRPRVYTKMAHEGGERKHDEVRYTYSGNKVIGNCKRKKWDKHGKLVRDEERTLEATGATVDMLSSFLYMRGLPYNEWKPGHTASLNIYSGKEKELLTIKYIGETTIEISGKDYNVYHIRFKFTNGGGKKSSDDMDAWISTGPRREPLKLEGKLPVGKVQCFMVNQ